MNRLNECDKFLKQMAYISKNTSLTSSNIYSYMVRIGVPQEYRDIDLSNIFSYWINHFQNEPNINVYVDPKWSYFCQFVNLNNADIELSDGIKMYIPVNPEFVYDCANELFEFMARNNIYNVSKIGKHPRFDNIVLRIYNKKDATRIQYFIDNNELIQRNLLPPNPFAIIKNNIAYAMDDKMSFNSELSLLIQKYIDYKKQCQMLDTVGIEDFKEFLRNYYINTYITGKNIQELNFKESQRIVNEEQILELLLISLDENATFADYMNHVDSCNDFMYKKGLIDDVNNLKNKDNDFDRVEMFLEEFIMQMSVQENFNFNDVLSKINRYINNPNSITIANNNIMYMVNKYLSPVLIKKIIYLRSGGSLAKYIEYVLNKYDKQSKVLSDVTHVMNSKYDFERTVGSLKGANLGYFTYVTRDGNCRNKMIDTFDKNNEVSHVIRMYLISKGYNNIDELDNIYQEYAYNVLNTDRKKELTV